MDSGKVSSLTPSTSRSWLFWDAGYSHGLSLNHARSSILEAKSKEPWMSFTGFHLRGSSPGASTLTGYWSAPAFRLMWPSRQSPSGRGLKHATKSTQQLQQKIGVGT